MATAIAKTNSVGAVSLAVLGQAGNILLVKVWDSAGRPVCEALVTRQMIDAALLVRAFQCPPIGFN